MSGLQRQVDERDPYSALAEAFAITVGDRIVPASGLLREGAVAPIVADEAFGLQIIREVLAERGAVLSGETGVIPVGDPWRFMRRAAGEGLCGIHGCNETKFPHIFQFMMRVEADRRRDERCPGA